MAPRIRAIHKTYFRELETVGRMLTDYGELELGLNELHRSNENAHIRSRIQNNVR